MKLLDFFWWFLDGDKSSREILVDKKKPQQRGYEPNEAFIDNVDEDCDEFFEFEEF